MCWHAAVCPAGVLSKSGTYLVQVSIQYDKCSKEQGQTRVNVGACPTSEQGSSKQSYELQSCKDVSEPGKRKLTLNSGSKGVNWQLVPSSSTGVSTESGSQPLSCSGSGCILTVGSGAGKVQPGRSYSIRYSTGDAAAQQQQQQQQQQQGSGVGFSLGLGGFGFGFGADGGSNAGSGSSGWRELKGPAVSWCGRGCV
jgi:hypothetical protein